MAKKPAIVGMYGVEIPKTAEQIKARLDDIAAEEAKLNDLSWLRDLNASLQRFANVDIETTESAVELSGFQSLWLTDLLLNDASSLSVAEVIRRSFLLGMLNERILLQETFDRMVGSSRNVSKANSSKAPKKSPLSESQWRKVCEFVHARGKHVSAASAFKDMKHALKTGTFRKLPSVSGVDIGEDAIKKQYKKYRDSLRAGKS